MNALAHGAAYAAIVVFLAAVAVRYWRIRNFPLNMRWEIYPIPHEGARSAYGGSKLEETDWWKKKQTCFSHETCIPRRSPTRSSAA